MNPFQENPIVRFGVTTANAPKTKSAGRRWRRLRAQFHDAGDYADALRQGGGPDGDELDFSRAGFGPSAEILRCVWGASEKDFLRIIQAEDAREQRHRPHIFVQKWAVGRKSGGQRVAKSTTDANMAEESKRRWVEEADFAEFYAAAEFASKFGLVLDTMITFSWKLLGVEQTAQEAFQNFTKCLGSWMRERKLPNAYLYAHECGSSIGLHSHIALFVEGLQAPDETNVACKSRKDFRNWVRNWAERIAGRPVPKAVRITGMGKVMRPWLHWLRVHYLLKGYNRNAVVQSAARAPDGDEVMLGDLMSIPWRDPGYVPIVPRFGVSRSLGPKQRALGVPPGFEHLLVPYQPPSIDPFRLENNNIPLPSRGAEVTGSFRSAFDDGCRDIRQLYPVSFNDRITRLVSPDTSTALPNTDPPDYRQNIPGTSMAMDIKYVDFKDEDPPDEQPNEEPDEEARDF